MIGFYKRTYNELENQINELLIEQENQLTSYEKAIAIIVQKLGKQLNSSVQRKTADNSPLIWTANKVSLTELIYAFTFARCI